MANIWLALAGGFGGLGVMLGAFGAHALRLWLPLQKMTIFETAVRYQLVHALALLAAALLMSLHPSLQAGLRRVCALFSAGLVLFCGGLYGAALTDAVPFMWVVPVGGVCWILAWGLLAHAGWRLPRGRN